MQPDLGWNLPPRVTQDECETQGCGYAKERCPACGNPMGISDEGSTVCRDCRMDQEEWD